MDLKLISQWEPGRGRVVEWRASETALRTAESATIHPVPPSMMQERHLRRAQISLNRNEAQTPPIGMVFDVQGPFNVHAMTRALQRFVVRHDTLRSWFSFEHSDIDPMNLAGKFRRHVVPPSAVTFVADAISNSATPTQIRNHVANHFSCGMSAITWPAFKFGVVVHDHAIDSLKGERFSLYYIVNHAHSDGYSMLLAFDELRTLYRDECEGAESELHEAGSFIEYSRREHARAAALSSKSREVRAWVDRLRSIEEYSPTPPHKVISPETCAIEVSRFEIANFEECDKFEAVCKSLGGNFLSGIFGALALSEKEIFNSVEYLALLPIATRKDPFFRFSQGWFINLVPVELNLRGHPDFVDLVRQASMACKLGKSLGEVTAHHAVDIWSSAATHRQKLGESRIGNIEDVFSSAQFVSYVDLNSLPEWEDVKTSNVIGLIAPGRSDGLSTWIQRTPDGLWFTVAFPDYHGVRDLLSCYVEKISSIIKNQVL